MVFVNVEDALQVRFTAVEYPAKPVTVSTSVAGVPRVMVRLALCGLTRKSGLVGPFHAAANAPTSTEPSPVVRSYPGPALKPIMPLPGQSLLPCVHGTMLLPVVMSWNDVGRTRRQTIENRIDVALRLIGLLYEQGYDTGEGWGRR